MARAVTVWLLASAIGVALMALLPEDLLGSGPLMRFNERHGPGGSDLIGLTLVLGGWVYFLRALWMQRRALRRRRLAASLALTGAMAFIGCLALLAAGRDLLAYTVGGVALAAQLGLGALSRCKTFDHSE